MKTLLEIATEIQALYDAESERHNKANAEITSDKRTPSPRLQCADDSYKGTVRS